MFRFSSEAEYWIMAHIMCKLLCLKNLLIKFGFNPESSMSMHCGNQSVIYIAKNLVFHYRTKHIEVDCHLVRDIIVFSNMFNKLDIIDINTLT